MIPAPSEILARELMRGPGLTLFVHQKAHHCARVNTAPGRIAIGIWDLSAYAGEITDHETKHVPGECIGNFPIGWKQVAHWMSESDTSGHWGDWILLPLPTGATERQEDALKDFMSTVNIDTS